MRVDTVPFKTMQMVTLLIDHHTLYVYGAELAADSGPIEEKATERAWESDEHVGSCFGMAAVLLPGQTYIDARVRLEEWATRPAEDETEWDFVVEFETPVRGGTLYLQGGGGAEAVAVPWWDGYYRARFSARGYTANGSAQTDAEFRLQLWAHDDAVQVVKQWHGWAV